jgi:hypothetical protein
MYRQIAAILLLLLFAAHNFNRAVIVLDYYTNTASFARNCENKAKPVMHCKGKCQMMKKLKEEEKKEQQNPTRRSDKNDEVVFAKPIIVVPTASSRNAQIAHPFSSDTSIPNGISTDIFRPPAGA